MAFFKKQTIFLKNYDIFNKMFVFLTIKQEQTAFLQKNYKKNCLNLKCQCYIYTVKQIKTSSHNLGL